MVFVMLVSTPIRWRLRRQSVVCLCALISSLILVFTLQAQIIKLFPMGRERQSSIVYIRMNGTAGTVFYNVMRSYKHWHSVRAVGADAAALEPELIIYNRLPPRPHILASDSTAVFHKHDDNTYYISSIQEPVQWFTGYLNSYYRNLGVDPKEVLKQDNLFYQQAGSIYRIHNVFLQQFGFSSSAVSVFNEREVMEYIEHIEKKYHLVMLAEYIDESLVLLRRLINCSMKDIFYMPRHRIHKLAEVSLSQEERAVLLDAKHNLGDQLLYLHMNRSFWNKINAYEDFYVELEEFRKLNTEVINFCDGGARGGAPGHRLFLSNSWEDDLLIDSAKCKDLHTETIK